MRLGQWVVVVHPPVVAGRLPSETVKDWANATRTNRRADVQERTTASQHANRDGTTTVADLVIEPVGAVVAGDRVEWRGRTFDVVGVPKVRHRRGGRAHHAEVELSEAVG